MVVGYYSTAYFIFTIKNYFSIDFFILIPKRRLPERFQVAFIMFYMFERLAIKGERGHSLLL